MNYDIVQQIEHHYKYYYKYKDTIKVIINYDNI